MYVCMYVCNKLCNSLDYVCSRPVVLPRCRCTFGMALGPAFCSRTSSLWRILTLRKTCFLPEPRIYISYLRPLPVLVVGKPMCSRRMRRLLSWVSWFCDYGKQSIGPWKTTVAKLRILEKLKFQSWLPSATNGFAHVHRWVRSTNILKLWCLVSCCQTRDVKKLFCIPNRWDNLKLKIMASMRIQEWTP